MTVFEQTISVLPEQCDGLGHVNNVQYLHWAEDLAWAHSSALGLGLARYQTLDCAMVAREHVLTYLAMAKRCFKATPIGCACNCLQAAPNACLWSFRPLMRCVTNKQTRI